MTSYLKDIREEYLVPIDHKYGGDGALFPPNPSISSNTLSCPSPNIPPSLLMCLFFSAAAAALQLIAHILVLLI